MLPFAWKSNKSVLFYFTQNSVSEIQFGDSVQRQGFGITATGNRVLVLPGPLRSVQIPPRIKKLKTKPIIYNPPPSAG